MSSSVLHFYLLGPPEMKWAGSLLSISRRQLRALLYIFAARPRPIPREQLCTLFWAEMPDAEARRHLTRLLTTLRRQLPDPDLLLATGDQVGLDVERTWSDVWLFDRLGPHITGSDQEMQLQAAVELYRDPFLMGFGLPGNAEFDSWVNQQRYHIERLYLEALSRLVELSAIRGEIDAAIGYARRYLAVDEIAEDMHRRLIDLYLASGDRDAALRQFERCTLVLEGELGVRPLPETRERYEAALHKKTPSSPLATPPDWKSWPGYELPLTGREQALSRMEGALLQAQKGKGSVILISGEPGIGKTRLMQHFASLAASRAEVLTGSAFPDARSVPYHPVLQVLRTAASQGWLQKQVSSPWLAVIARLIPELSAMIPGVPVRASQENGPEMALFYEALCQIFCELGEGPRPVLLCLDDLHQADSATLDWLGCLGRHLQERKLLVIASYNSDEPGTLKALDSSLTRLGILQKFNLAGFSVAEIRSILKGVGLKGERGEDLPARFFNLTGGNPFYLQEYLRIYTAVNLDKARPVISEPPPALRALIQQRLDRLSPLARQLLDAAAVLEIGFGFDQVHLTAGRQDLETVHGLDELVARQLLVERGTQYHFSEEAVRMVVLGGISYWRRRLLQRRAAAAMQKLQQIKADGLARPGEMSAERLAAARYALQAGRLALSSFAFAEALSCFDQALDLLNEA